MILCLDSGNSRIKWGLWSAGDWLVQGAVSHDDVFELAALPQHHSSPRRVLLANVAGDGAAAAIQAALGSWGAQIEIVRSTAQCAGVYNDYQTPSQLGVDRWCALLGAHRLVDGPTIVVMAGTATTIDTLAADGHFRGGLILPGIELMRRALARDTAALPLAEGAHAVWPRCTADAIISGILEAQVGAIERARARLGESANCLLSGGNAALLAPYLDISHRLVDQLPLLGLLEIARQA